MIEGIKNGKKLHITLCDDIDTNKGGYYCQVYDNENCDNEIDNFVIHKNENIEQAIQNYLNE